MNDVLNNRLRMVGACLLLADSPEHQAVWTGQPPVAFGLELASLKVAYAAAVELGSQASSTITGAAVQKDLAETTLENAAFVLAHALTLHFKKTGNLTDQGRVDVSLSRIRRLRDQNLLALAADIRTLANNATTTAGAADRGITEARITALAAAISAYEAALNAPRSQIVNRTALLRELETQVTGLLAALDDLDDLILQFAGTMSGDLFLSAWRPARQILNAGHGPSTPPSPEPSN